MEPIQLKRNGILHQILQFPGQSANFVDCTTCDIGLRLINRLLMMVILLIVIPNVLFGFSMPFAAWIIEGSINGFLSTNPVTAGVNALHFITSEPDSFTTLTFVLARAFGLMLVVGALGTMVMILICYVIHLLYKVTMRGSLRLVKSGSSYEILSAMKDKICIPIKFVNKD